MRKPVTVSGNMLRLGSQLNPREAVRQPMQGEIRMVWGTLFLGVVALWGNKASAFERDVDPNRTPSFSVALGTNAISYRYETRDGGARIVQPGGYHLSVRYFHNNQLGLDADFYDVEGDDFSDEYDTTTNSIQRPRVKSISAMGWRAGIVAGWNLRDRGFKAFAGLGFYSENTRVEMVDRTVVSDRPTGTALKFGVGYNRESYSLDWWVGYRDGNADGLVPGWSSQGALSLSYRF